MGIAIVTGASSGMGREFVLALDREAQFEEIWVIARRRERLEELEGQTRAKLRPLAMDLTREENWDRFAALLAERKPRVDVLVNAGGFGLFRPFEGNPLSEQLRMIDLNDKALTAITYHALPYLGTGSRIFNIGSLSSFQPVPYIGVYAASKAYVLSFSRALNVELKPRGIRVLAVCPGWVRTEFFDTAVRDETIVYYNRWYEPEQVVGHALRDMRRGKDVSVCGLPVRLQVLAVKLLPHKLVMAIWCRQQKKPV